MMAAQHQSLYPITYTEKAQRACSKITTLVYPLTEDGRSVHGIEPMIKMLASIHRRRGRGSQSGTELRGVIEERLCADRRAHPAPIPNSEATVPAAVTTMPYTQLTLRKSIVTRTRHPAGARGFQPYQL